MKRGWLAGWIGMGLALLLTGCSPIGNQSRGEHPGDLTRIRPGMTEEAIVDKVGPPSRIVEGEGLSIQDSVWVYPKGNIHVRRMVVLRVAMGEPPPGDVVTSMNVATQRYMSGGTSFHSDDERWYREEDERFNKKEEMRNKREDTLFRPSVRPAGR